MADLLALRDWLFAKESKRLLLHALLEEPEKVWTRTELAHHAGLHPKARMDLHLGPLISADLIRRTPSGGYRLAEGSDVAVILRELLVALGARLPGLPE